MPISNLQRNKLAPLVSATLLALAIVTNKASAASASPVLSKASPPSLKRQALASAARPNIILIVADDLGWGDLSVYGHPSIRTPNLDRMAHEGQRWTNFYVAAPTCSPSRAAMLTGRVEARSGLYGVRYGVMAEDDPHGFPDRERTVASVLKTAGYRTALFGKWHLGDAPRAYPTRHGFDYWWGLPLSNDAFFVGGTPTAELRKKAAAGMSRSDLIAIYTREARASFQNPINELWNMPLLKSQRTGTEDAPRFIDETVERPFDQASFSGRLTDEVLKYINASDKTPFFAFVGLEKPHLPHIPSKAYAGKSAAGAFGDVMMELDASVGRILDALRLSGKDKNTLVIFTSDNGPWYLFEEFGGSAGMLRDAKSSTYEGGVRVPALFWQPGKIKPALVDGIGSTLDFMPTFAALANATLPDTTLDGYDLRSSLQANAPSPRSTMPYYQNGQLMAWRDGHWKINFFEANGRTYQTKKLESPTLYHLARDPGEKFDLATTEQAVVERLTNAAKQFEASFTKAEPEFDRRLKSVANSAAPKPAPKQE